MNLNERDVVHQAGIDRRADRFWTFQAIEADISPVLATALIAVTAAVLLRGDA
jgi:hypothetical protein